MLSMCKVIIKIYDVCLVSLLGSKFQLPGWPDGRNVPVWPASCKNSGLSYSYFPSQRHLVHVLITYSYRGNCVHVILVAERLGSLCQISRAFTHTSFSCCSCTVAFAVLNLNLSTRCCEVLPANHRIHKTNTMKDLVGQYLLLSFFRS